MRTVLGAVVMSWAGAAVAAPMTHQGRLLDAGGDPVNGTYEVVVSLVEGDGEVPFSESHSVPFEDGYYAVRLGTQQPIDPAIFDEPLTVRLTIDSVVMNEQPLASVPSALSVDGRVRLSGTGGPCTPAGEGALHYSDGRLLLCDGTDWVAVFGKRSLKPMTLLVNNSMADEEGNYTFSTTSAIRFVTPASEGSHSLTAQIYGSSGTGTPDWAAQSQPDAQWTLDEDYADWALEWDYRHTSDNGYERILFATSTQWADDFNGWCPSGGNPSKYLSEGWMVCAFWGGSSLYFHGTNEAVVWPYVGYHSDFKRLKLVRRGETIEFFIDGVSQGTRPMPAIVSSPEPVLYISGSTNGGVSSYTPSNGLTERSQMDRIRFGAP